jgi:hypothetical protein
MARVKNNPLLKNVSGKLGNHVVYKNYSFGTVMSMYPDMSKVIPTEKQLREKGRFGNAVRYAKRILADPEKKAAYQLKLKKGGSVYHAAIAEYMKMERNIDQTPA